LQAMQIPKVARVYGQQCRMEKIIAM